MGKFKKSKKGRNKQGNEGKWDETPRRSYQDIVRENEDFEKYYKLQGICPDSEWDTFITSIKENLPTTFRITGSKVEARALLKVVKSEFFKDILNPTQNSKTVDESVGENEELSPDELKLINLPWYPDGLAWQLKLTRKDIRRSEEYFRLHNFLISETNSGNISRQEAVSMIPPLVLDVQSHHKVLDMCAAPGSKTSQLIELLHGDNNNIPTGYVIANDIDNKRCYMLVHQAKRLNSPCIIITNQDSGAMPNFITKSDGKPSIVKFDRILCDVPCSGDGTMRKNPDIWLKWNAANGNNLHRIQWRILRRGLEMLEIGGQIVYSTCSLNPVEDEAVISRILKEANGAVELLDVTSKLPGLKFVPGMSHWLPASRDIKGYEKYEDVPEEWHQQIIPQMFPPSKEEAENIRVLPHHQDTGGFFVAVLVKNKLLPWESEKKEVELENKDQEKGSKRENDKTNEPQRKKRRIQGYKEDPFIFFDENEPLWPLIRNFYEIDSKLDPTCLLTRCKEGKKKNIYFTSPGVRDIVINNADRVKLINTGVKTFVRCYNTDMECAFRLAQEGLQSIIPFIGPKRRVPITKDDLITLLTCDNPKLPPEIFRLSPKCQEHLNAISQGSCVLSFVEEDNKNDPDNNPLKLHLVGWRGKTSARGYVPTADCVHYLRLCGADVSKYDVNKFKNKPTGDLSGEGDSNSVKIDVECEVNENEPEEIIEADAEVEKMETANTVS
ncbi:tRNA (cytosine(34)-C(5))-methyltransferase [Gryllus bimaculatus]|nr:tRNA (cytosine(34)-C(5))-methyltransferase [Gryllus bimaculatus]